METRFSKEACDIAEELGREIFEKFLISQGVKQYGFSEYQFESYDCWFIYSGKKYLVEIKNRAEKYSTYNDMLIEKPKYMTLVEQSKQFDAEALYVNVYKGTNIVKIANLSKYGSIDWRNEYHQRTQLGSQQPIEKKIALLTNYHKFTI